MPGLEYITDKPPNAAIPVSELDGKLIPQDRAYMRNSFDIPDAEGVSGVVEVSIPGLPPTTLTSQTLSSLDQVEIDMVLECAGNARSLVRPEVSGLEWGLGGASPIRAGGVRLIDALGEIPGKIIEFVLTGADQGTVWPEGEINYQFSVPAQRVMDGSALLMLSWGGDPLALEHGGPIRFLMPGDYAMRSVKWLTRIEGVTEPFEGHFVNRYRYFGDEELDDGSSVGTIRVRSVIARPGKGEIVPAGTTTVSGSAWSGAGTVEQVAVSLDRGVTWEPSEITAGAGALAAVAWRHEIVVTPGRHTVMALATDSAGNSQPLLPRWNKNGYANNVVHSVSFEAF